MHTLSWYGWSHGYLITGLDTTNNELRKDAMTQDAPVITSPQVSGKQHLMPQGMLLLIISTLLLLVWLLLVWRYEVLRREGRNLMAATAQELEANIDLLSLPTEASRWQQVKEI